MKAELRLSYRAEDEWHGQIEASVTSGAFSGAGIAWFGRQYLQDTFIKALREFPLSSESPPAMRGGFWNSQRHDNLEQCHLRIVVRPYDVHGNLLVKVDVATEIWTDEDKDRQQTATARFLTDYTAILAFSFDLDEVLNGHRDHAILLESTV